jgi:hypothetical protein
MRHFPAKAGMPAIIALLTLLLCSSIRGAEADNAAASKPKPNAEETSSFNLAKLSAEARVVYVSSGSLPPRQANDRR